MKALLAGLLLAYPLLAHLAIARRSPALTLASVAVLSTVILLPGLLARRRGAWLALLPLALLFVLLARVEDAALVLYAPPILINVMLAWVFGRTLQAARMPLIEQLVRALHPPEEELDARIPGYTRRLTALWCALFVLLAAVNLVLALFAVPGGILQALGWQPSFTLPVAFAAWFANVGSWVLVGALFGIEYAWRRHVFPQQPYRNFIDFLRRVIAAGPRLWGSGARR